MTKDFDLIDPPALVRIEYRITENLDSSRSSTAFVNFRWHDADYWILGKLFSRNIMAIGCVTLRLPKGKKQYWAGAFVQSQKNPVTFSVSSSRVRHFAKTSTFVFLGFDPGRVVNMDYVREEEHRLSTLWYMGIPLRVGKISRPPAGLIV